MAKGINKVILVGNMGQTAEVKYMPSGDAVANVSLATAESWKDKSSGEDQVRTEWHRLVFYKRLAEVVSEYTQKGSRIYIEGKLQTRCWEQDGAKRYSTDIVVSQLLLLDGNTTQHQQPINPQQLKPSKPKQVVSPNQQTAQPQLDDDIPF